MRILTGHKHPIGKLRFSPDGRWLLAAAQAHTAVLFGQGTIRLWGLSAGTSREIPGAFHTEFTPDSRSLLHTVGDGPRPQATSVELANLATNASTRLAVRGRTDGDFEFPRFSPDGSLPVSSGNWELAMQQGQIVLKWTRFPGWESAGEWRMARPNSASQEIGILSGCFMDVVFSPNGQTLAGLLTPGVYLFDVKTGAQTHFLAVRSRQGSGFLAYHPNGGQFVSARGTKLSVFDSGTWTEVATLRQPQKHFQAGAFTPDGRRFLTASNEETVKCWDTATWTLVREYAWQIGGLASVAVAPDGMTAAAGGEKKKVVVWDLDD
jgi:WD40 repeat protein